MNPQHAHILGVNTSFFAWWRDELKGIFSAPEGHKQQRSRHRIVVAAGSRGVRWIEEKDQGLRSIGLETTTADPTVATRDFILAKTTKRAALPLGIRLDKDQCLERHVVLPTAARADWDRILALDIERATPFKTADVYSGFVEDTRSPEDAGTPAPKGKAALRHFIVKRALIDAPAATLQGHGLTVTFADCWDDALDRCVPLNFLAPVPLSPGAAPPPSRVTVTMSVLALGLAVSAAVFSLQKYEAALLGLDRDIAAAKARVQTLRQTISRSEAALSLAAALERLKHDSPRPAAVLEAMTRALPDDTYLSDLNISQGRVAIAGHSAKAVALVDGLEASDMFSSVEMTAPVLFDQSASKEQFRIDVRITSSDARHDAAAPSATADPGPANSPAREAP